MISGILVKIISITLLIAVGVVLILGIGTLFKGGETSKKYSNKLMQMRVLLQFIAIIALVSFAYFFKNYLKPLTHSINSLFSKFIDPIILANSNPSLLIKTVVGIPLSPSFLAKVVGGSKYKSKLLIFKSLKNL